MTDTKLTQLISMIIANHTPEEMAIGFLRYEAVRRMSPRMFHELYLLNLNGADFDDLMNDVVKENREKLQSLNR